MPDDASLPDAQKAAPRPLSPLALDPPPDITVAVVVPCYRVTAHIADVIAGVPTGIRHVVVVDDGCPDDSGQAAEATGDPRLTVLRNEHNGGVGAAMVTGYRWALANGVDIVVKMDGDGQMDPSVLPRLLEPLLHDEADYAKGNRFRDFAALKSMPRGRLFGNAALSFTIKWASGYWNLMDPTNGYTAITTATLRKLTLDRIDRGYFFESDMLIRLNPLDAVVADVPMPARYGDETSSLKLGRTALSFPGKIVRGAMRRLVLRYFLYDFNMASVYLLLGLPLFLFGVIFGAVEWIAGIADGTPRPVGTIMLAVLPIIIGFQMLLQAINIDIMSVPPKRPARAVATRH